MGEIKKLYPDVRVLVGNSIYVKASVVTASGEEYLSTISDAIRVEVPVKQPNLVWVLTGSDLVDAEKTGVKIVQSPYVVSFKDVVKYFKPGHPFDFTVRTAAAALAFLLQSNQTAQVGVSSADPREQPGRLPCSERPSQGQPPGLPPGGLRRSGPGHHQHAPKPAASADHREYGRVLPPRRGS